MQVRAAGDKRWRAAVEARFRQVRDKQLASAALACEQLINRATQQLTQVLLTFIWQKIHQSRAVYTFPSGGKLWAAQMRT